MVKLGIIGMSPGNGHPYSWSAICNGYNKEAIEKCGFPAISRYLCEKNFPSDFIDNAFVTHVWTQDYSRSCHIALASNIRNVVTDFRDLIGEVDAIYWHAMILKIIYIIQNPFLELACLYI